MATPPTSTDEDGDVEMEEDFSKPVYVLRPSLRMPVAFYTPSLEQTRLSIAHLSRRELSDEEEYAIDIFSCGRTRISEDLREWILTHRRRRRRIRRLDVEQRLLRSPLLAYWERRLCLPNSDSHPMLRYLRDSVCRMADWVEDGGTWRSPLMQLSAPEPLRKHLFHMLVDDGLQHCVGLESSHALRFSVPADLEIDLRWCYRSLIVESLCYPIDDDDDLDDVNSIPLTLPTDCFHDSFPVISRLLTRHISTISSYGHHFLPGMGLILLQCPSDNVDFSAVTTLACDFWDRSDHRIGILVLTDPTTRLRDKIPETVRVTVEGVMPERNLRTFIHSLGCQVLPSITTGGFINSSFVSTYYSLRHGKSGDSSDVFNSAFVRLVDAARKTGMNVTALVNEDRLAAHTWGEGWIQRYVTNTSWETNCQMMGMFLAGRLKYRAFDALSSVEDRDRSLRRTGRRGASSTKQGRFSNRLFAHFSPLHAHSFRSLVSQNRKKPKSIFMTTRIMARLSASGSYTTSCGMLSDPDSDEHRKRMTTLFPSSRQPAKPGRASGRAKRTVRRADRDSFSPLLSRDSARRRRLGWRVGFASRTPGPQLARSEMVASQHHVRVLRQPYSEVGVGESWSELKRMVMNEPIGNQDDRVDVGVLEEFETYLFHEDAD